MIDMKRKVYRLRETVVLIAGYWLGLTLLIYAVASWGEGRWLPLANLQVVAYYWGLLIGGVVLLSVVVGSFEA